MNSICWDICPTEAISYMEGSDWGKMVIEREECVASTSGPWTGPQKIQ